MMKNILIVLTVLAMASVANAALLISVNGRTDLEDTAFDLDWTISETAVIDVWGDGQTPAKPDKTPWLTVEGPATVSGGVMLYPGSLAALTQITSGGIWDAVKGMLPNLTGLYQIEFVDADPPEGPYDPLTGTLVDEIELHCIGDGDVLLSLYDKNLGSTYDTQVIHQIPEPITFALLGLGGLFLRRRK